MAGGDAAKSTNARNVIARILDTAVWVNCHMLPHSERVLEVRVRDGYGARWHLSSPANEQLSFRGFLEPYMPDGHAVGWRHAPPPQTETVTPTQAP
jgi:hypothetical protein